MSIVNGLGFYESINKLIIGFLLLFLFVKPDFESSQGVLFLILAYIIGCIYQAIIRSLTKSWLILRECEIAKAYKQIYKIEYSEKDIKDLYLQSYYEITNAGLLLNIPINEALENFMRNLAPVLALYLVVIVSNCNDLTPFLNNSTTDAIFVFLLLICVYVLRFYYQKEVYRLVWEAIYYWDKIKDKNRLNYEKGN
ncbi:hypothetical protein [Hoylesella buccalis]|uniref:Uncharacterized protein n=1 Tax=Hoylesella buccalis DNF00853 TaxID=1401074 RepID=A0A096BIB9_9BACT|nr:hypothetical protein [Hoylesella buccalis]KGF32889.1 hypothetical protein HMPREF2137_12840 [Hoylesella buccalis DNF00853]